MRSILSLQLRRRFAGRSSNRRAWQTLLCLVAFLGMLPPGNALLTARSAASSHIIPGTYYVPGDKILLYRPPNSSYDCTASYQEGQVVDWNSNVIHITISGNTVFNSSNQAIGFTVSN